MNNIKHIGSKSKAIFFIILLLLCAAGLGFSESVNTPPVSAQYTGKGGLHTANNKGFSVLYTNPGALYSVETETAFSELTLNMSGPIFDIASVVVQSMEGEMNKILATSQVQDLIRGLYASLDIVGPLYFGYIGNGLGFGVINSTNVTFTNPQSMLVQADISETVNLYGGYSFRIPLPQTWNSSLDAGFMLKALLKGETGLNKSLLEIPALFESVSADLLMEQEFTFTSGIGADAGILYQYGNIFSFGIAARDIYTPTFNHHYTSLSSFLDGNETPEAENSRYPFILQSGVRIQPPLGNLNKYISNVNIYIDYNDIFGYFTHRATYKHPLLYAGIGTELTLLEVLSLRTGFYEGLFNAGLGLDLTIFNLQASMYGRELSTEPGMRSVYNFCIGFEFRM